MALVECINAESADVWLGTAQGVVQVDPTSPVGAMQVLFADDIGFVRDVARVDADVVVCRPERRALPHGTTSARVVAERIHEAIAEVGRVHSGAPKGTVSVSIGYAIAGPETTAAELIKEADAALYWAKGHGRDQVAAAGDRREPSEE